MIHGSESEHGKVRCIEHHNHMSAYLNCRQAVSLETGALTCSKNVVAYAHHMMIMMLMICRISNLDGDAEIDFIPVDGLNLQTWTTIIRLRRQMTLQVELGESL